MTLQNDLLEKFAAAREDFVRFLGVDGVVTDGEALKEYRAPFGQMPTTATIHPSCSYQPQRSRCRRSYGFPHDMAYRSRPTRPVEIIAMVALESDIEVQFPSRFEG